MHHTTIWISCSIPKLGESKLDGVGEDCLKKQVSSNLSTRNLSTANIRNFW